MVRRNFYLVHRRNKQKNKKDLNWAQEEGMGNFNLIQQNEVFSEEVRKVAQEIRDSL